MLSPPAIRRQMRPAFQKRPTSLLDSSKNPQPALCDRFDEPELRQGRNSVIEADFLDDLAVLELKGGRSGELHLATGVGRQRSHQKVAEGRSGVCATPLPTADDIVAFRDQVGGAPEVEVWKRVP